jgi:hypothetical protein
MGVVEIDPIVLVGRQHRTQARNPAVIDMIDRSVVQTACRYVDLGVVGVVMPFQVVKGAGERGPGLRPVEGMHSVVLGLPRTDRGEGVVVVKHLDRAIDIPIVGGTHGGVEDSAVFVDGHCSATRRTHGYRNVAGIAAPGRLVALGDHVRTVTIGERERRARQGAPISPSGYWSGTADRSSPAGRCRWRCPRHLDWTPATQRTRVVDGFIRVRGTYSL